jgi:hypothetical protein
MRMAPLTTAVPSTEPSRTLPDPVWICACPDT